MPEQAKIEYVFFAYEPGGSLRWTGFVQASSLDEAFAMVAEDRDDGEWVISVVPSGEMTTRRVSKSSSLNWRS